MRQTVLRPVSAKSFLSSILSFVLGAAILVAAAPAALANSKYAAIVIDANTGKTLFQSSATEPRYPASLTKMMTLYLTFEAMQAGRISKSTRVPFSAQAASRPPTKIGVRAGGSVTVEQAILSLVTKSANDAATALGELLGGSEQNFARLMTAKARRLGMNGTQFRNASGLPDDAQRTTARDMAILGLALREHYPNYYGYFSTRSFTLGKSRMANHNRLLGRVKGVDGIKTGYVRASGFNLVTSVQDDGKSLVAVVMGGVSGRARDDHMASLIKTYLPKASRRDAGPLVAKRVIEAAPNVTVASAAPMPTPASAQAKIAAPVPPARPVAETVVAYAEPEPAAVEAIAALKRANQAAEEELDPVSTASVKASGWAIQVASLPSKPEALAFLDKTTKRAPTLLADATAFTETFAKGGATYYRARFGGFSSKDAAWKACTALKRQDIGCYAVQQ